MPQALTGTADYRRQSSLWRNATRRAPPLRIAGPGAAHRTTRNGPKNAPRNAPRDGKEQPATAKTAAVTGGYWSGRQDRIRTCDPLVPNDGGSRCLCILRGGPRRASIGAPPRCNVYVVCYAYIQDGRLRDLTGAWGYGLFLYEAREGGQVTHILGGQERDARRRPPLTQAHRGAAAGGEELRTMSPRRQAAAEEEEKSHAS